MKFSIRITLLVIAMTFATITVAAQDTKWTRYSTDEGNFSALLPPGALIDAEKGDFGEMFKVYGFLPGVEIILTARKIPADSIVMSSPGSKDQRRSFKIGKFNVTKSENTADGRYRSSVGIADSKISYNLNVAGPSADTPEVVRALFGLRIDGKPVLAQEKPETEETAPVLFSKLVSSAEIVEAKKRKIVNLKGQVTYEAGTTGDVETQKPKFSRRAIIVERPFPVMDISGSGTGVPQMRGYASFEATIRVTLRADGQIGDIVFIGTGKSDFSKRVEQVARKIRFVPAQIDGRNVDSEEVVKYQMLSAVYR